MMIISKYKDYYDYLQGIYGVDELKVLDRRSENPYLKPRFIQFPDDDKYCHYTFAICGELYDIFEWNGKLYHTYEEFVELSKLHEEEINITYKGQRYSYKKDGKFSWLSKDLTEKIWDEMQGRKTNANHTQRKPILVDVNYGTRYYSERRYDWNDSVVLDEFKFIKKLSAEEIWVKLDIFLGWLNDNPEKVSNITNEEKIKTKGFDIKKSFRHRKNK